MDNQSLQITGRVHLEVIDVQTGKVVRVIDEPNLVVNNGKNAIAKAIGNLGGFAAKIGVGTNGTATAPTDSALTGAFTKNLSGSAVASGNTVTLTYDLFNSEANGINIQEMGILDASNNLIARKVISGPILKNNAFAIHGTWTFEIN